MSARLARALVTTGAAALALGLFAPSAALADAKDGGHDGKGGKHDGGSSSSAEHGEDGKAGKDAKSGKGKSDSKGDPAGNNGTIKIEPYGSTDGHANHPHPGCDFRLQMFGFDDDQTGTITFVGQAPTKGAVAAQPLSGHQLLSDDAAGGGKDVDAFYDVRGASLGLTGTPAKQGFHIKVLVDADNAPGGAKSKVFWLNCTPTAPATGGPTTPAQSDTTTGDTTVAPAETGDTTTGAVSGGTTVVPAESGVSAESETSDVTGLTAGAATSGAATSGAATSGTAARTTGHATRGTALPFTGVPLAALLSLAVAALVAGALAIRAGRRRTSAL